MHAKEVLTPYGLLVLIIAAFGGFLFGYHTGVISGALVFLNPIFQLNPSQEGMVVSIMLLGGLFGAVASGHLADRFGRKKAMFLMAFLFVIGSLVIAFSSSYGQVLVGRGISGIAIGIVSVVAPLYLAEIAPPHYRGRCVSAFQLLISLGILSSFIAAFVFSKDQHWQMPFIMGALLSFFQIVALCFIPESPSWTMSHRRVSQTIKTLTRLREDTQWKKELENMSKKLNATLKWNFFLKPYMLRILMVGCILSAFQQITGINAVIYYTPKIFKAVGITSNIGSFLATLSIGCINCIATVFSLWALDRMGRRILLLIGSFGMAVSLCVVSYVFFRAIHVHVFWALVGLMGYVACFAFSLGPAIWVVLSEIFPLEIRSHAIACCLALNWLANYVVSFVFPNMIATWGGGLSFALFAAISLIAFLFVYRCIFETKGKSLEEIENLVKSGKF